MSYESGASFNICRDDGISDSFEAVSLGGGGGMDFAGLQKKR